MFRKQALTMAGNSGVALLTIVWQKFNFLIITVQSFGKYSRFVRHVYVRQREASFIEDDFAFLEGQLIFRHPPNENPSTDRYEILQL
jgi:hypothetical protein